MREELRTEIVDKLRFAANMSRDDASDEAFSTLADEVEAELEEGDEVECPTSKYNERFMVDGGIETGDLVKLIGAEESLGLGEVTHRLETGGEVVLSVDWMNDPPPPHRYHESQLEVADMSGRARTMHVAYVSWHDDVVVVTDDDGCNAEIVTHAQCTRVARS